MPRKDLERPSQPSRETQGLLGSDLRRTAQRPCSPEVPPPHHASKLVGTQRAGTLMHSLSWPMNISSSGRRHGPRANALFSWLVAQKEAPSWALVH